PAATTRAATRPLCRAPITPAAIPPTTVILPTPARTSHETGQTRCVWRMSPEGKHRPMYEVEQLIGGHWGAGGDGRLTVLDPADDTPVSRVPVATPVEVETAVMAARKAAGEWARTPATERAAALRRAADAREDAADRLAEAQTAEMGRPLREARAAVAAGVGTLRQYAELGPLHRGK